MGTGWWYWVLVLGGAGTSAFKFSPCRRIRTSHPGTLELIASGFSEAAIAVNQAVHWVYPDKQVASGHSSNLAIFGQSPD
jgi:hypothetical protein